jgi:hypothetical protein
MDLTEKLALPNIISKLTKPASTLVHLSDGLLIHDFPERKHEILYTWDRERLLGAEPSSNLEHLQCVVKRYTVESAPLLLGPAEATEDPVTYVFVHDVAPKLGWKIHSASYPGAQGDVVILPKGYGRQRKRTYIDSIASRENRGILFEAKDSESGAYSDAEKLNDLVENEFDAITKTYQELGVVISEPPLKVCGFFTPNHIFDDGPFYGLIDGVVTLDNVTKTWKLHSFSKNLDDDSGPYNIPMILAVR